VQKTLTEDVDRIDNAALIRQYYLKHFLTREQGNDLIALVKSLDYGTVPKLPKDIRTLMPCELKPHIEIREDYSYVYIGIEKTFNFVGLPDNFFFDPDVSEIIMTAHTDGVRIFHSSTMEIWPVLGRVGKFTIFVIAGWCGDGQPAEGNIIMQDFVNEVKRLTKFGVQVRGRKYKFTLDKILADAVAISLILYFPGHAGFSSCVYCTVFGEYKNHRTCFPDVSNARPRTIADFETCTKSALFQIFGFHPSVKIPIDIMHLAWLGVAKKLLQLYTGSPKEILRKFRILTEEQKTDVEELLKSLNAYLPVEFGRGEIRPLKKKKFWKATEFRSFLLYYGPVVFHQILPTKEYKNLIELHVCLRILSNEELCGDMTLLDSVEVMMYHFVDEFARIYGPAFVSHNVHNLVHVTQHVRIYSNRYV